jgi:tRNA (mo5U34)-methyltransferase
MFTRDKKVELSRSIEWYHCIDLGDGVITNGVNKVPLTERLRLPRSLKGKTVLDNCAWDGLYSFECEKRGAQRVLATDSFCWSDVSFPGSTTLGTKQGFLMAREILNSGVEDQNIGPEDVAPETVGRFDIVLLLGVVYHMKNPILVLQNSWNIARELLVVESHIDERFGNDTPVSVFYPGRELNGDETNWWGPNRICLEMMLRTLSPEPRGVKLVDFQLGRAIFHAIR